jgi:hypothetical protein
MWFNKIQNKKDVFIFKVQSAAGMVQHNFKIIQYLEDVIHCGKQIFHEKIAHSSFIMVNESLEK